MKNIKIYVNPNELEKWIVGMEVKFMSHYYSFTERKELITAVVDCVDYERSVVSLSYDSSLYVNIENKIDIYEIKSYEQVK